MFNTRVHKVITSLLLVVVLGSEAKVKGVEVCVVVEPEVAKVPPARVINGNCVVVLLYFSLIFSDSPKELLLTR